MLPRLTVETLMYGGRPKKEKYLDGQLLINLGFTPTLKSGTCFRYEMTNSGELGWISDRQGYRYVKVNPQTGKPWPAIPSNVMDVISYLKRNGYISADFFAQSMLVNKYEIGQGLGLHQDISEQNLEAEIISISLGTPGIFLLGGDKRTDPVEEILLQPGDIFIMKGEHRMKFHGFRRITCPGKRLALTIRQVY